MLLWSYCFNEISDVVMHLELCVPQVQENTGLRKPLLTHKKDATEFDLNAAESREAGRSCEVGDAASKHASVKSSSLIAPVTPPHLARARAVATSSKLIVNAPSLRLCKKIAKNTISLPCKPRLDSSRASLNAISMAVGDTEQSRSVYYITQKYGACPLSYKLATGTTCYDTL